MALRILLGLVLVASITAANAAPKSEPATASDDERIVIRDCVTFLRLYQLQQSAIDRDTTRLDLLRADRASGAPAADADIEIGKLAYAIEKDQVVLAAIDRRYKACLQAPPWTVAIAVPTAPAPETRKPKVERKTTTTSRASRPAPERPRPGPPPGGHNPNASALMGITGFSFGF